MDIAILLCDKNNEFENKKAFSFKSARDIAASALQKIVSKVKIIDKAELAQNTTAALIDKLCEVCGNEGATNLIFAMGGCPFLSSVLIKKVLNAHLSYNADFTQCDGFIDGVAPVAIKCETLFLLQKLLKMDLYKNIACQSASQNSLFYVIERDINSYEVEDVICDDDYRLLRLSLNCSCKQNFISCVNLYNKILPQNNNTNTCNDTSNNKEPALPRYFCDDSDDSDIDSLQKLAKNSVDVLRTVPNFYCVSSDMEQSKFADLMQLISDESDTAIISIESPKINLIKEVFKHSGLKLLIELGSGPFISIKRAGGVNCNEVSDDLKNISDSLCKEIKEIISTSQARRGNDEYFFDICWIVDFTDVLGGDDTLQMSVFNTLYNNFPGFVYPEMTRKISNEEYLEKFYRYWSDDNSPSGGVLSIKKYSNYCGTIPNENPVDLSPVERNYCYHLRRDMLIYANGDVPHCQFQPKNIIGNVFDKGYKENSGNNGEGDFIKASPSCENGETNIDIIQEIFKRADSNSECESCDEYYTFNF